MRKTKRFRAIYEKPGDKPVSDGRATPDGNWPENPPPNVEITDSIGFQQAHLQEPHNRFQQHIRFSVKDLSASRDTTKAENTYLRRKKTVNEEAGCKRRCG